MKKFEEAVAHAAIKVSPRVAPALCGRDFVLAAVGLAAALVAGAGHAQDYDAGAFKIRGVHIYDPGQLAAFAHQHVAAHDSIVTPNRYAEAIELIYHEDGYFLARAWPVVDRDGRLTYVVVDEGSIGTLEILGADDGTRAQIARYFRHVTDDVPPHIGDFERALMLSDDLAGVSVGSELEVDTQPGPAHVRLEVNQERQRGSITVDTPPGQQDEALSAYLVQEFYGLGGAGSLLRFELAGTSFYDQGDSDLSGSVTYRFPFGSRGEYAEFYGGNIRGDRAAKGPLVATELKGASYGFALGLPLRRTVGHYSYALIEAFHNEVESEGGGATFLSSTDVIAASWIRGDAHANGASTEVAVTLATGQRGDPSPTAIDDGDDDFWYARLGAGLETPLGRRDSGYWLDLDIWAQATSSRLPAVEEMYFGGRNSLRGYLSGEVGGDRAVGATLTLGRTLESGFAMIPEWAPYAFIDAASVSNVRPGAFEIGSTTLYSAGAGTQIGFQSDFLLDLWIGVAGKDGPVTRAGDVAGYVGVSKSW